MLQKKTFDFLKQLKKNNNKQWFDTNRKWYEESKKDFIVLVEEVLNEIVKFDRDFGIVKAKDCLFRINRDIRFSKDKSPYKTNFGASMNREGKKSPGPGYYLHIEPGNSFLAGGVYMPPPDQLAAIRQEIDYNLNEFQKIISAKEFNKYYRKLDDSDKLTSPPRGYEKNNPAIEWLKYKSYIVVHSLKDEQVLGNKFKTHAGKVFNALYPLNNFLKRATD